MDSPWRDGFLFVGNQLALDFLNTRPVLDAGPTDLIPDCDALVRWLSAAGLVSGSAQTALKRRWVTPESAATLDELRRFRETLRKTAIALEAGTLPASPFLEELNRLLLAYPYQDQVVRKDSRLEREKRFQPQTPLETFAPLAYAAASLFTDLDSSRIRKCKLCELHFYDTSKKGTRVWCSMQLCGNRSKVAAYAERKRSADGGK